MSRSEALATAVSLRFPLWEKGTAARQKIGDLEDYICVTAFWQGALMQERLDTYEQLADQESEWAHLDGWQAFRRNKTEAGVEDAKRQLRPDLYDAIRDERARVKQLTEQIDRLEREATKASRVYTLITGS